MEQLAPSSCDIMLFLVGYYNGKRNNTVIEPQKIKKEVGEINSYCYQHRETTVMDAVNLASTNKFTQHSYWSRTTKQAGCSSTEGGGKRRGVIEKSPSS